MGHGEEVPADIAKTLVGWKKHFNAYTQKGRFNVSSKTHGMTFFLRLVDLCFLFHHKIDRYAFTWINNSFDALLYKWQKEGEEIRLQLCLFDT